MSRPLEDALISGNAEWHARLEKFYVCVALDEAQEVGV
jgi:hypothetical protein